MLYEQLIRPPGIGPDASAIVHGERRLSRAELDRAAVALAGQLAGRGIGPDSTLAYRMPNSIEMVVALLAGIRLQVRLLLLDPALKPAEAAEYCRRASAQMILVPPGGGAPTGPEQDLPLLAVAPAEELAAAGAQADCGLRVPEGPDRTSFLFLSSGSTGTPKLVLCSATHLAEVIRLFCELWPHGPGDRMAAVLPLFHVWGLRHMVATTLAVGGSLHLLPAAPRALAAAIARERITILPATPFIFRLLVETEFDRTPDFSSLRLPISGGAPQLPAMAERFAEKFGPGMVQVYGSTEVALALHAGPSDWTAEGGWRWRRCPGVELSVRDAYDREAGGGEIGTLAVRSPACADGYLGDPEATAEVFRNGWAMTGDAVCRGPDGRFTLLGRVRPMLNVAGKKVSPAEVEDCLRRHPAVREVVVSGTKTADGDERIRALVETSVPTSAQELREFCAARLADFKVPREIKFTVAVATGPLLKARLGSDATPGEQDPQEGKA